MNYMVPSRNMIGSVIRASRGDGLSDDRLRAAVPSIFADRPHESRSDRYTYIPTINVVHGLDEAGFKIVEARQGRSRVPGKTEFTKHMLRFRHSTRDLRVGDTVAEIVLLNSHDGTSQYKLMSGLFKLICLNGMVLPAGPYSEIGVRHTGNVVQEVVEGSSVVLDNATKTLEKPKQWSQLHLTHQHRGAFAEAAHVLRFGDAEGHVDTPITPAQLLHPRRREDAGHDLWSTFNVVQENVIKGHLYGSRLEENGRIRRTTTREVRGIDQDVKLNRALWVLAEKLAESV